MWRLYVLADFLCDYGLLEVGLAMLDGSYWKEAIYHDNFPDAGSSPNAAFGGGD